MKRITTKELKLLVDRINRETQSPMEYSLPWRGGKIVFCVGHFHLDKAYGKYALLRTANVSGGTTSPLLLGHVSKRELYDAMHAFLAGYRTALQDKEDDELL